jgi:exosome complex RNA-binding protein Rrp4
MPKMRYNYDLATKERYMLQFTVEVDTPKQAMLALLNFAEQVLEHDARIEGKTLDDAELEDATVEDCFEDLRSKIHMLVETVDYLVD